MIDYTCLRVSRDVCPVKNNIVKFSIFFKGDSRWYESLCAAVDEVLEKKFYCEYWTYRLMVGGVRAGLNLCGGGGA